MCQREFLVGGYCDSGRSVIAPAVARPRVKAINGKIRCYAMAIRAMLHSGEKRAWDHHNVRRSWL